MEKSTKGEKTMGKIVEPLFPRLHVDDTKKIGPRAPPRNKMALTEQLSIPSQRFSNTPSSTLHPPIYGRMLTNISASSQGVVTQRGMLLPFQTCPIPIHSNGRNTHSNEGISKNSTGNSIKRSMIIHPDIINVAENPLPTVTFRPSFEPCNLSQFKWPPFLPKYEPVGLRYQTFVRDNFQVGASCSLELQTSSPKEPRSSKLASTEDQTLETSQGHEKNSAVTDQAREKIFPKISLKPDFCEEEHSKVSEHLPNGQHKKNSELNQTSIIKDRAQMNLSTRGTDIYGGESTSEEQKSLVDDSGAPVFRNQSCHEFPVNTKNVNDRIENCEDGNPRKEKSSSTCQVKFEFKSEDLSHTPVKDGDSCVVISPDVLMEMIGQKHFWQARKAIIRQQRDFSMQVFELHRIIKVQRRLMESGNLQQTEHLPYSKSLVDQTRMTDLILEPFPEAPSWHGLPRNEVVKNKVTADSLTGKPPDTFSLNSDAKTVASNSVQSFSKPANNNLAMWSLPTPRNQWLLPVISPSEGLIYKPYPHHHPTPPRGVLTTLYSECGPTNPTTPSEEFRVCGPAVLDPAYFAPYGMPMNNPYTSGSSVKQLTALTGFNNFGAGYPSSCVLTGEQVSGGVKYKDKLESSVSGSKKIRDSNDALPLFPITPTSLDVGQPVQTCNNDQQKTQVIKVIPRNPKLASESAARIVKLIQEERKHCCN